MRISDWSSYVFSSDLPITLIVEIDAAFPVGDKIFQFQQPLAITRYQRPGPGDLILGIIGVGAERCLAAEHIKSISQDRIDTLRAAVEGIAEELDRAEISAARNSCRYQQIGRASCRERVCQYV